MFLYCYSWTVIKGTMWAFVCVFMPALHVEIEFHFGNICIFMVWTLWTCHSVHIFFPLQEIWYPLKLINNAVKRGVFWHKSLKSDTSLPFTLIRGSFHDFVESSGVVIIRLLTIKWVKNEIKKLEYETFLNCS